MGEKEISFRLRVYESVNELTAADKNLLKAAQNALGSAYAPYSKFRVAAALLLNDGRIVTGTNQENASFPAGICAEGTALSAASAVYPGEAVIKIAITIKNENRVISQPVAPCGICRQRLLEYENRFNNSIEVIMAGEDGPVYIVPTVKDLLPLHFSGSVL
ncbi:MAG TPA: cytidine deaminase [Chitinophagales bacterium]|nr:cytidine deaminase [Chitinophagales bacterium]